jgi:DNA invertase Pin-like site-specific DNA recombinase
MCTAAVRREFDVIMSWTVDRLGRSLQHLITFLGEIHAKGVDLYLHQQCLDTCPLRRIISQDASAEHTIPR